MANTRLGLTLPIRLGKNGYFETTTDEMAQVKSNLMNLLLTQKGERLMQPTFGCDLASLVFDTTTDDGQASIEAAIQIAVSDWMPFVGIDEVRVGRSADSEHKIMVSIKYTLLTRGFTDGFTLEF